MTLYMKLRRKFYSVLENRLLKPVAAPNKNTLLLIRLDSIGDYVLFRNFIATLKQGKYKNYTITLCGNAWWKELSEVLDKDTVNEFIWIDYAKMNDAGYRYSVEKNIYEKKYEVVLHPVYSRDRIGDRLVIHSGAAEKIGYDGDTVNISAEEKKTNDAYFSKLIPSGTPYTFEFYRHQTFFDAVNEHRVKLERPEIPLNAKEEELIILCPGAKDAFRRWSPQHFAELCVLLKKQFPAASFMICGSAADSASAKAIMERSEYSFSDQTGKLSLVQLMEMMAKAKLIVTNDSGPFHIAAALGKKAVAISNGNNYGRFTPYPEAMKTQSRVVYPQEVLNFNEQERIARFGREVKEIDINVISAEAVYAEIKTLFS